MGGTNLFESLRKRAIAFRIMTSLYWPSLWRSNLIMFVLFFVLSIFMSCFFIFLFIIKQVVGVLANVDVTMGFRYFVPPMLIVFLVAMIFMCGIFGQFLFRYDMVLRRTPRLCNHASSITLYLLGAGALAPLLIIQSFIEAREIDKFSILAESVLLQIWTVVAVLTVREQQNIEPLGKEQPKYFLGRTLVLLAGTVFLPFIAFIATMFIANVLTFIGLLENGGFELFLFFQNSLNAIAEWIISVKNTDLNRWPVILAATMTLLMLRAVRLISYLKNSQDCESFVDHHVIDAKIVTIFLIQLCFLIFAILEFRSGYSIMLINLLLGAISPSISDYFYHSYFQKRG